MQLKDKVVVVTGGGNGIGEALCRRFVEEQARAVVVTDIDEERAKAVAGDLNTLGLKVDVTVEQNIIDAVKETEKQFGPIDLFCSNAGVLWSDEPDWMATSCTNQFWQKSWEVNVMAHVYAARAVLPGMIKRGGGYLLNTASAAGLLNQIGSASYGVTKHASLAFAESLAITHGHQGIKVSALCPQAVRTQMLVGGEDSSATVDGVLEPEDVAQSVIEGLAEEAFLILPHPEVQTYFGRKASDYDRWIGGMNRLRLKIIPDSIPSED